MMKKNITVIVLLALAMATLFSQGLGEQSADTAVRTKHSALIRGQMIDYTATAGTITVYNGESACEIFYIAYTRDGVQDIRQRPITFAFNGGPSVASMYINYLCMGPMHMEIDDNGYSTDLPAKLVNNYNSLLDITDLVFIDAPDTGYSFTDDNPDDFIGYHNDVYAISDFIMTYLINNGRVGSPLYIAGESYGTTRAVGICNVLAEDCSLGVRGLMLLSSVNDFMYYAFDNGSNDIPYAMFTPTFAADAWYHGCLDKSYQDMALEDYLDLVRTFVLDEYYPALFKGRSLSAEKKDEIAEKYASFTGLSKDFVLASNLRVDMNAFSDRLLEKQGLIVGRYDGRFKGKKTSGSLETGTADPSNFDRDLPLQAAVYHYISQDLGYKTDRIYNPISWLANSNWTYDSDNTYFSQETVIRDSLTKNGKMKIWVMCGYYDGATPFFAAENVYNHVFIDESRQDNISFTYYPAGHMFYLDKSSFEQFREYAEKWYQI